MRFGPHTANYNDILSSFPILHIESIANVTLLQHLKKALETHQTVYKQYCAQYKNDKNTSNFAFKSA